MIQKALIILVMASSLLVFGCNSSTQNQYQGEHNKAGESLELNKGEKWVTNEAMLTHIRNMEQDVTSVAETSDKDYKMLAERLKNNINLVISSCTMTGEPHEALHKWLHPFIEMVDELAKAEKNEEADVLFKKIEESFVTFNTYFQ